MEFKTTRSLFRGKYQYKIVLVCAGSSWFRSGDSETILNHLRKVTIDTGQSRNVWQRVSTIKSQEDLEYAVQLANALSKMQDIDLRVESPWISIYTNNKSHVDLLTKLDQSKVKYICKPDKGTVLEENTVIMPKINYDFRVTLGKTSQPNLGFITWATANKKCRLTKSCIRDLEKARSWGGTHFYITGDNNLLMAKMHLSGTIAKIERIVKS